MTNQCHFCQGKTFKALGMNAIEVALDREAAPDGEYTITNGRAVRFEDAKDASPSVKRYRRHQCGKGGSR